MTRPSNAHLWDLRDQIEQEIRPKLLQMRINETSSTLRLDTSYVNSIYHIKQEKPKFEPIRKREGFHQYKKPIEKKLVKNGRDSAGKFVKQRIIKESSQDGRTKFDSYSSWSSLMNKTTNRIGSNAAGCCPRWKTWKNFFNDMGERPHGKRLRRKDIKKPFSPQNCYWGN